MVLGRRVSRQASELCLLTPDFVVYTILSMAKIPASSEAVGEIAQRCLATRMRRLNRVVSGIYDRAFRPMGLTGSQMSILVVLAGSGGSKPAEVCLALQMDKSTLCRNVQRMQRQGWVRSSAGDDARSHRLEVTETGRELIERALPMWREAQARAREVLGGAVVDQLFQAVDSPVFGDHAVVRGVSARDSGVGSAELRVSGLAVKPAASPDPVQEADSSGEKPIFFWE